MADVKIRITEEKVGNAIAETDKDLKNFAGSFTELKSKLDLALQAAEIFGQVLSEAMEIGREGAAISQTTESFERLTQQLGASKDLLQQLRDASRGTVDDMTLMSSTMTLVAGAEGELADQLLEATPELLKIAKAAYDLNPLLGDTAFQYESITRGIKRNSPMILDNLGIIVKIGEANEKYAEELGKTVEQLTASEQKQALLQETLRVGQILIEQAGESTANTTDSFARMDTAITNLGDAMKAKFAPTIADVADGIYYLITGSSELSTALENHNESLKTSGMTYEEYAAEIERSNELLGRTVEVYDDHIAVLGKVGGGVRNVADELGILTRQQYEAAQAIREFSENGLAMGNTLAFAAETAKNTADGSMTDLDAVTQELGDNSKFLSKDMVDLLLDMENLGERVDEVAQISRDYNVVIDEMTTSFDANRQKVLEIIDGLDTYYDSQILASEGVDKHKTSVDALTESIERLQATGAVANIGGSGGGAPGGAPFGGTGGGNVYSVTITAGALLSFADEQALKDKLAPIIREVVRTM